MFIDAPIGVRPPPAGWRQTDRADPEPRALAEPVSPEALDDDPPLTSAEMAELSRKRARRAMLDGRGREAQSWTKVHETWRKLAAEDADAERRAALAAETPEETFAKRMERRDYEARLDDLMGADRDAGEAAEADADDVDEAEAARILHDLHDLHSSSGAASEPTPPDRRRRRALARLEALKARQAARGGP